MSSSIDSDLLVYADPHFDEYRNYQNKSRKDIEEFIKMYDYAIENKIPYAINIGDLFRKSNKVDSEVFSDIYSVIKRASNKGVKTISIPGNHDITISNKFGKNIIRVFGDKLKDGCSLWSSGDINSNYVSWECCCINMINMYDHKIGFIPYSDSSNKLIDDINYCKDNRCKIIFGHFSINEYDFNSKINSDFLFKGIKNTTFMLGHIHKRNFISDNKGNKIIFIGSLFQEDFDEEEHDTGYVLYNFDENKFIFKETNSLKFKRFYFNDEKTYKKFLKSKKGGKYDNYILRGYYGDNFKNQTMTFPDEIDFSYTNRNKMFDGIKGGFDTKNLLKNYIKDNCKTDSKFVYKLGKKLISEGR